MQITAHTHARSAGRVDEHSASEWTVPVLEPAPNGPAARFASALGTNRHPLIVFLVAVIGGLAVIAGLSIGAAYLLTDGVAHVWGIGAANRRFDGFLAVHRTPSRTDASLIGSIAAGGVVLPIVAASIGVVCAILRKWRIAAFIAFALAVESGAYRVTTLAFHEHRPHVVRLENLPVNASYPSGHTAASIAVYGGIVLLLTSMIHNRAFRIAAWTVALAIPVYVGMSRMYRGMHYPLDVTGGALLGIAALTVVVFACRAAGAAAESRRAGSGA